ncbi:MAG: Flp pilus assembly protein CpaB [Pseudomonadota bacterium]
MSPMRIIILLIAAVAAAGAAFLVRNMSQQPVAAPVQVAPPPQQITQVIEVPQTPVLVLTRDVSVGDLLYPTDFAWKEWPDETLNVNYYTQDIFPTAMEDLTSSVVRLSMVENEPVLPHKVVQKGEAGYMSALLTPGMRAVSVEISVDRASGGFILPGDRVDVHITTDVEVEVEGIEENRPTTLTLMENVRILAIDQVFGEGTGGQFAIGSTATVELYPDQARLIILAERLGPVSMTLRSLQDFVEGGPTLARTDFLIDVLPQEDIAPDERDPSEVRVYRNGDLTVDQVDTSGGS